MAEIDFVPDQTPSPVDFKVLKPSAKTPGIDFIESKPELTGSQSVYTKYRPLIKGTLEPLLTGGGAIVGGGAGLATPIPGGAALGGATGATLGFAGSQEIMDILDQTFGVTGRKELLEELKELPGELKAGAEVGFGGELIPPIVQKGVAPIAKQIFKPIKKFVIQPIKNILGKLPPLSRSSIKQRAGEILADVGTEGTKEQIKKNMAVAHQLESKIPGLKFTRGQLTNDAEAIILERSLARKGGADFTQEQISFSNKAIKNYFNNKLTSVGKVSDFTEALVSQQEGLESVLTTKQGRVDAEILRLSQTLDDQGISKSIVNRLTTGKEALRVQVDKAFKMIPKKNRVVPVGLEKKITNIMDGINPNEAPSDIPKKLINDILTKLRPAKQPVAKFIQEFKPTGRTSTMSIDDLRAFSSRASNAAFKSGGGIKPNRRLADLNNKIKKAINLELDELAELADPSGTIKNAVGLRRLMGERFEQGTIADVLQRGSRGEETRIAMSNIAGEFFNKDSIDQFMAVMGDDVLSKTAMRDFAKYDLLNKTLDTNGQFTTKKVLRWMKTNEKILEKLGIKQDFANTTKLQQAMDFAKKNLDVFNKSVASRVINADIDSAVQAAFKTGKNPAVTANELMNLVKGNKAAENGLKKAFSENLLRQSETTGLDLLQEPVVSFAALTRQIKKFGPAMKVIYRGEPEKLKAIGDIHKAYNILGRTLKSPLGGGSDTAENIMNEIVSVATPLATSRFALVNAVKAVTRVFTGFSQKQINSYLLRATFDADYAQSLIQLAKTSGGPQSVTRLNGLMSLISLGAKDITDDIKGIVESEEGGRLDAAQ